MGRSTCTHQTPGVETPTKGSTVNVPPVTRSPVLVHYDCGEICRGGVDVGKGVSAAYGDSGVGDETGSGGHTFRLGVASVGTVVRRQTCWIWRTPSGRTSSATGALGSFTPPLPGGTDRTPPLVRDKGVWSLKRTRTGPGRPSPSNDRTKHSSSTVRHVDGDLCVVTGSVWTRVTGPEGGPQGSRELFPGLPAVSPPVTRPHLSTPRPTSLLCSTRKISILGSGLSIGVHGRKGHGD